MEKGQKMKAPTKELVRERQLTFKNKFEQSEHDLNELKSLVVKCFTACPVACDGVLMVSADNYNALADHLNKL